MVVISFSVDRLWDHICNGTKTRTMRPYLYGDKINQKAVQVQHKIQKGEQVWLDLYWKARSPHPVKIVTVPLTNITVREVGSLTEAEWKADGFSSVEEGQTWFAEMYMAKHYDPHFQIFLYEWKCNNCQACQHQMRCLSDPTYEAKQGIDYFTWINEDYLCFSFNPRKASFRWRTYPELVMWKRGYEDDADENDEDAIISRDIFDTMQPEEMQLLDEEIEDRNATHRRYRFTCPHCEFVSEYFHIVCMHQAMNKRCRKRQLSAPCYPVVTYTPPGAPIP
jgi:hypothetical protein